MVNFVPRQRGPSLVGSYLPPERNARRWSSQHANSHRCCSDPEVRIEFCLRARLQPCRNINQRKGALALRYALNVLDRFLKTKLTSSAPDRVEEQAVLIHFANEDLEGSTPLQLALDELLTNSEVGMFDGNEVGDDTLVLYLYGPALSFSSDTLNLFFAPTNFVEEQKL
jgi:hypothetical protein